MDDEPMVTVGVDTHTDVHVAAVLDQTGRLLGTRDFSATMRGYTQLATWVESFGKVDKVGMEGTGHFGAGLLRFLTGYGLTVVEVDRPDRSAPPPQRQVRSAGCRVRRPRGPVRPRQRHTEEP